MPRALVINADADFRSVCRATLEGAGYEAQEAGDAAGGVRAFARRPADLVLCAVDGEGPTAAWAIRVLRHDARVLAVSGHAELEEAVRKAAG